MCASGFLNPKAGAYDEPETELHEMSLDELRAKARENEEDLAAARVREAADVDGGHDDEATDDVFN